MIPRSLDARAEVLAAAHACARQRGDARIGTDHLLIGVVSAGNDVARAAGLSVETLQQALDRLDGFALGAIGIDADPETLTPATPEVLDPCSREHRRRLSRHLPLSVGAKRSLHKSALVARDHRQRFINTNHLLAALTTGDHKDPAVRLLRSVPVEPADLDRAVRAALAGI